MSDKKQTNKSTQSFLKVSEVRSDTMILEDRTYRAVIAVASINFALKNPEEQNALIFAYQNFINSLDFEIQILMQSRRMDIHSYLNNLKNLMQSQSNELLRIQTGEYIEFISKLVESASVMNKSFYVIVPYSEGPIKNESGGIGATLRGNSKDKYEKKVKEFEDKKVKLDQRLQTVIGGLSSMGLRSMRLETPELIELVYNSYNFDAGPQIDATQLHDINIKE